MTNCEHLIENALISMKEAKDKEADVHEAFQDEMNHDYNKAMLREVCVTKKELWEIAQYIMYVYEDCIKSDVRAEMEDHYGYKLDQRNYLY